MIAWIKPKNGGKATLVKIHYCSCLGYGLLFVVTVIKGDTDLLCKTFILDSRSKNFNPYPIVVRRNPLLGMYRGLKTCSDNISKSYPII